jgi:hypothetical protein
MADDVQATAPSAGTTAIDLQDLTARQRDLLRLLPLWPHEVADETPAGRRRIIALLRRALRAERQRGLAGHWTYDLSRHAQLIAVYRTEISVLGARPPR